SWLRTSTLTESIWIRPTRSSTRCRWRRVMRPVGRPSFIPWAPSASRRASDADSRSRPATVVSSVGDGDRDRLDHDVVLRPITGAGRHLLHRVEHVETLHDLAEQAVLRREAGTARAGDQEELAAVGVRPGVGHRDRPDLVLAGLGQLVLEAVAGAAAAGA